MKRAAATVEPLRDRNFRLLWTATLVGYFGGFLHAVAASWLMLELTGSALWVGLMAGSSTLPVLLLALPAGVVADMVDKRKVLFASHLLMAAAALTMAAMWFLGVSTPGRLLGLGLLIGVGVAFNLPASQAIIPDLVPRGLVANAVALNSAGFNVARALGPALGGIVVVVAGPGLPFAVNALSYVATLVAAKAIRGTRRAERESSVGSAIAIGIRYVRFTSPLLRLIGLVALFAMSAAGLQAILPNLTDERLGGGAGTYGTLLGAMGAGALVGTWSRSRATSALGGWMVPASILGVGLSGVVVGLSRTPLQTGAAMVAVGVFWIWVLVTLSSTAQLLAPDWVRGRVMSLYTMVYPGAIPAGALLAGLLGEALGPGPAIAWLSVGTMLISVVARRAALPTPDLVTAPGHMETELHQEHGLEGGPVMVSNTWWIEGDELEELLELMDRLRILRLRSGAYRWRLYREAADPHVITEVFLIRSWEDHLRQHSRTDPEAARLIDRTRAMDGVKGPLTRHMVAFEVADPLKRPRFEDLGAARDGVHGELPPRDDPHR